MDEMIRQWRDYNTKHSPEHCVLPQRKLIIRMEYKTNTTSKFAESHKSFLEVQVVFRSDDQNIFHSQNKIRLKRERKTSPDTKMTSNSSVHYSQGLEFSIT